jgi:hypothetical protein
MSEAPHGSQRPRQAYWRSPFFVASPDDPPRRATVMINHAVHADCFLVRWVGLGDYSTGPQDWGFVRSYPPFWKVVQRLVGPHLLRLAVSSAGASKLSEEPDSAVRIGGLALK